ncbi:putative amidoligase enzyme-domain-containing protein [Daldinia sp. FL1419]|nr:putative amidoligase enzyme-domain-containing protein [Daldinia sp. FL1419]
MTSFDEFTVPIGTRPSFGIELEFLVAYLPTKELDPDKIYADELPPLLRIDTSDYKATVEIIESIRATLRANGIPVSEGTVSAKKNQQESPARLEKQDKWKIALDTSVSEKFVDKYRWQAIEIQSPALWANNESFQEIRYVTNVLTYNYRLRVNPTCGFHVHVGNGVDFFTGEAIKRLGMLLWTADPALSRLHAPWRRVFQHSASIRYHSRLATQGMTMEDVRKENDTWLSTDDPLRVTKFSSTSWEETAYGGKAGWEKYAKWRNDVGPFLTLKDDTNYLIPKGDSSEDAPDDASGDSNDSVSYVLPTLEEVAKEGRSIRRRLNIDLPPEDHTQHRNVGWIRWDALQATEVIDAVYFYSKIQFGTTDIASLEATDQTRLLVQAQCQYLYNLKPSQLNDEQFETVLALCESYFESARIGWRYDTSTESFRIQQPLIGPLLTTPRPKKEERINSPLIISQWENVAQLMEPGVDGNHPTLSEYNEAIQTNKGISELFEKFTPHANTSTHQHEISSSLSSLLHESSTTSSPPYPSEISFSPSGFDSQPQFIVDEQFSSPPPVSPGSPALYDSNYLYYEDTSTCPFPPFDPDFYTEADYNNEHSLDHEHEFKHDAEAEPDLFEDKLLPHDADNITALYQGKIDKYARIPDAMWDRIGWLPSIEHPLPDPAGENAKDDPIHSNAFADADPAKCKLNPVTSGIQGLANLAGCDSAMAIATLLSGPFSRRLNYNFKNYSAMDLQDAREDGISSLNPRTVEFREAGGTLDAGWIELWARITVGIVQFARRASPAAYLAVLDRLLEQEERDAGIKAAKRKGTYVIEDPAEWVRYDVCNFLEDIGLFVEAALVRKREQEFGPPR